MAQFINRGKQDRPRDLENAFRIILGKQYEDYESSLLKLNYDSLEKRREILSEKFALNCLKNPKTKMHFPKNDKKHKMQTRHQEIIKVTKAKRKRLQKSSIIYLQKQLNKMHYKKYK